MNSTETRSRVTIKHPLWCINYPENGTTVPRECDGEHQGHDYRLDAGETAAYRVSVTVVEMFEVTHGVVLDHGARVRLTVHDRESGGQPAAAYLDATEVERLRHLLELAARDMDLPDRR